MLENIYEFAIKILSAFNRRHFRTIAMSSTNDCKDIFCVLSSIKSSTVVNGKHIKLFEDEFAKFHGGGYTHSFSAGRVALSAILNSFEISYGDEIILPGFTCVAVPNPILFLGATPVYVDIEVNTYNIDPNKIEDKITTRTKAIIVQHTFGLPADLDRILCIAKKHNLKVIEDCTHALGARYKGRLVGTIGDASFYSFEQTKVMSTGMGGVTYTKNSLLAQKINEFQNKCLWPDESDERRRLAYILYIIICNSPITFQFGKILYYYLEKRGIILAPETTPLEMSGKCPDNFYTRLADGHAKLALHQFKRLRENLQHRQSIVGIYNTIITIHQNEIPSFAEHIFLRYPLWVKNKQKAFEYMHANEIGIGLWFDSTVHPKEVDYADVKYVSGCCPNAEEAVKHVINLPTHTRMNKKDAIRVATVINKYLKEYEL